MDLKANARLELHWVEDQPHAGRLLHAEVLGLLDFKSQWENFKLLASLFGPYEKLELFIPWCLENGGKGLVRFA